MFIPLKAREGEKFDPGRDIVLIVDGTFQKKKTLLTNPIGIVGKDNPVIAAINLFDTSVSIQDNQTVAIGISCDKRTQNQVDLALANRLKNGINQEMTNKVDHLDEFIGSMEEDEGEETNEADREHYNVT